MPRLCPLSVRESRSPRDGQVAVERSSFAADLNRRRTPRQARIELNVDRRLPLASSLSSEHVQFSLLLPNMLGIRHPWMPSWRGSDQIAISNCNLGVRPQTDDERQATNTLPGAGQPDVDPRRRPNCRREVLDGCERSRQDGAMGPLGTTSPIQSSRSPDQ